MNGVENTKNTTADLPCFKVWRLVVGDVRMTLEIDVIFCDDDFFVL